MFNRVKSCSILFICFFWLRFRIRIRLPRIRRPNPPPCSATNCAWNNWGGWGACDRHCGGSGIQSRHRSVRMAPSCGGRGCTGDSVDKKSCNRVCYNGGTVWNDGTCHCTYKYDGQCCEHCTPKNCDWKDWGRWGECDTYCGDSGMQARHRSKETASCGGNECNGDSVEKRSCKRKCYNGGSLWQNDTCHCKSQFYGQCCEHCSERPCMWNNWGQWSECDRQCGGSGTQLRQRSKMQTASCGGNECYGDSVEEKSCNRLCHNGGTLSHDGTCHCTNQYHGQCCEHCTPKNCDWKDWGRWGECDRQCGGSGTQLRQRSKMQTASCGGNECDGDSVEKKSCNRVCYNGGTVWNDGTCHCTYKYDGQCCEHCTPKNCDWKDWGRWGECDTYCGDSGMQARHRSKETASCGGNECDGDSVEKRSCKRKCYNGGSLWQNDTCHCKSQFYGQCCEHCSVRPCAWSGWGRWGECDRSCGGSGMQSRHRSKEPPASCGGEDCKGDSEQKKSCNRMCKNGGMLNGETCDCPSQYYGQCCQHQQYTDKGKIHVILT